MYVSSIVYRGEGNMKKVKSSYSEECWVARVGIISLALIAALSATLWLGVPAFAASATPAYAVSLSVLTSDSVTKADAISAIDLSSLSTQDITAIRSGKWIEIRLAQQRLIAWQNGRIVMSSAISSGVRAHPTLRGTFHIYVKYRATRMRGPGYNLPNVPYTMYYSGSYGIHGAYWHNNFGHPMSHGCINLPVSFSRQLFYWAPVGTLVVIH
jgi:lipoprotein-anchoring transpeptidase ErfK/SrfK